MHRISIESSGVPGGGPLGGNLDSALSGVKNETYWTDPPRAADMAGVYDKTVSALTRTKRECAGNDIHETAMVPTARRTQNPGHSVFTRASCGTYI